MFARGRCLHKLLRIKGSYIHGIDRYPFDRIFSIISRRFIWRNSPLFAFGSIIEKCTVITRRCPWMKRTSCDEAIYVYRNVYDLCISFFFNSLSFFFLHIATYINTIRNVKVYIAELEIFVLQGCLRYP